MPMVPNMISNILYWLLITCVHFITGEIRCDPDFLANNIVSAIPYTYHLLAYEKHSITV